MGRLLAALSAAFACCLAGLAFAAEQGAGQEPVRPNFVIVMSDDQAPQMNPALRSVERLIADRGTTFENAFASFPLCCPSRASLLTGQYAHNHGTTGNNPQSGGGYGALLQKDRNLAAWLQAAGYDTAFAGKWLNGYRTPRRAPPGWDEWHGLVGAGGEGLSSFYDYDVFEPDGSPRHFGTATADYQTDVLTREYAQPFIAEHSSDPDPFFLWVAYHPPHDGLGRDDAAGRRCSNGPPASRRGVQSAIPPARYAGRFARIAAPRTPSFDERVITDKPAGVRNLPRLDRSALERIERDYRCGLAAMLALDDGVTAIVDQLRATGELDQTVLIFTADQGVLAGQHRIARGKNRPYEEAIDIPLVISGPGIAAGRRIDSPVMNGDLAPTILDLAGAGVPPELARPFDGSSLAPQLAGAGAGADRAILIEGRNKPERARRGFRVRSYVGVRTSRYAYTEYRRAGYPTATAASAAPIGAGRVTDREVYDLKLDPYELENRSRDRAYDRTRAALAGLTAQLERCAAAECLVAAEVAGPRPGG